MEADGAQPNMKQQPLEGPLVYVGRVKELTNLCSEYEILIAVQEDTCAGGQSRPVPLCCAGLLWLSSETSDHQEVSDRAEEFVSIEQAVDLALPSLKFVRGDNVVLKG